MTTEAGHEMEAAIESDPLPPLQARLVRLQIAQLKLQRVRDGLALGLSIFAALAASVIGLGLLVMLNDAFSSRSVIVEAFQAPAALAADGVTGSVVAGEVLDGLSRIQGATRSAAKKRRLTNAWTGDIKVVVPNTGVSIGEIQRLLHERFGHDLHIGGDLVQVGDDRLALTVRGDGIQAAIFEGGKDELRSLTTQAAEYIYGQSDPYLYTVYLGGVGRDEDAVAFLAKAYPKAVEAERPRLLNTWGNRLINLVHPAEAATKFRLAIKLQPTYWIAWGNLQEAVRTAEGDEAAWRVSTAMDAAAKSAPKSSQPTPIQYENLHALVWDLPGGLADNAYDQKTNGEAGSTTESAPALIANIQSQMHDWSAADRYLAQTDPELSFAKFLRLRVPADHAAEAGDWTAAVPQYEAAYAVWKSDSHLRGERPDGPCSLGLAYAMTGRMKEATAIFDQMSRYVACAAYRGDALEHAGDRAGADAAYARAVALAPDLPFAAYRWGLALLARRDLGGAEARFRFANGKGPHWADPLKGLGDSLARQGRWKDALAAYDAALPDAPNWAELRQARASAAQRAG